METFVILVKCADFTFFRGTRIKICNNTIAYSLVVVNSVLSC